MKKETPMGFRFWFAMGGLTFMFAVLVLVSTILPRWGRKLEAEIVREVDEMVK
jgi:hypothetical protein